MSAKFTELLCKEVICIGDGRRLGFIQDVLINGDISARLLMLTIDITGSCFRFDIIGDGQVQPFTGGDVHLIEYNVS